MNILKVIFAGGGTAGHINPALAIASHLKEKEHNVEILYIGKNGGMEERLVKNAGFNFKGINITGFSRLKNLEGFKKNILTIKYLFNSIIDCKKIIKKFNPDICIGTGGYVSGPVLWAATGLKIPILIHEQNAFPGITTRILAKKAAKVMLAVEDSKKYFKGVKSFAVTGNPVRKEIIMASRRDSRKALGLDERPLILSFGGSLGAQKINEAIKDLIVDVSKDDRFQHIHAYGQNGRWFIKELNKCGVDLDKHKNFDIREYIDNMSTCLAAADLVISRSGAISLSEIEVQGKASILIPSPNVSENHQYHNAMVLVNHGAANIIEETYLTGDKLISLVDKMLKDHNELDKYRKNALKLAVIDTNERIYKIIKEIVK